MKNLSHPTPTTGTNSADAVLAEYIASARDAALPDAVALRARCHLLDTLAATLSGRFLAAGVFGYRFVEGLGEMRGATLLGDTRQSSVEYSAFANAMAAHADETDDSHVRGRFHPGCGVVPAALAVGENRGATSDVLLRAIALGYDVGARSTIALGFSNPRTTNFSTHSFGALFGSAAASGALLGLSPAQSEALLSFTVQQASGLSYWNRDPDHVEKSFDFGAKSARNGVFAALLAKAGMTAPDHPLTGPRSYLEAYAENPMPEALTDGLGSRFEVAHSTIKKWSVGSPLQSVLDAVGEVFDQAPTPAETIAEIVVHLPSNRIHVVDDKHMPAVCAQHLVALATLRGPVSFAASHDTSLMQDPEILALRQKIRLVSDEDLTHAKPERQSIVAVRTADGEERRHHAKVVRGTPDDPMSAEEVAAKARDILSPLLTDGGERLITMCLQEDFSVADLAAACVIAPSVLASNEGH
jgi:2-methylcitrate dehydratase PrpD